MTSIIPIINDGIIYIGTFACLWIQNGSISDVGKLIMLEHQSAEILNMSLWKENEERISWEEIEIEKERKNMKWCRK